MNEIIHALPENLNANVIQNEELEEHRNYVGRKKNTQWLCLVFHNTKTQALTMHVDKRD
jgi:hypothetical protein